MKNKIVAMLVLLGLVLGNPLTVFARTGQASSLNEKNALIEIGQNDATVTFGDLGFRETALVSPYDSTRVLFSIPANWRLAPGGVVQLDYEIVLSGSDAGLVGTQNNPYGGSVLVTFNNQVVGTLSLQKLGPQTAQFQLPPESLTATRQDGRHQLALSLDAQFSCLYNIRAIVTIKPTSTFNLQFNVSSPELDLSRLPAPFHLRNALVPDKTLLVTPDHPDPKELKAALNLMSGFGSIVGEDFDFGLVPAGEVSSDNLASSNLIFVGRPEQFDLLSNIKFPLSVENKKFANLPAESKTDGVVEMAISPWNESKVVMLVSGSSTDAVLKAAQAVSSGKVLIYQNPALAYVADVQMLSDSLPVVQDFTLQSLGYKTETLSGIGLDSIQYSFNASKEQLNAKDTYINLMYYHSGLVDYGYSSFSVELNNQLIASNSFTKESEQLTTLQVKIPPGTLRFGENRLTVSARMLATTTCDSTGFSNPWLTISDQTNFHLPTATDANADVPALLDLKSYPGLFTTQSDLGDVAFVLPKSNPTTWKLAGQLAYELGRTANPLISNLEALYADDTSQQVLASHSLIVIGRASTIPLLSEINKQLPAPFDAKTDTASESNMQVVYRIPKGLSVGYLEVLNSPYNVDKPILVLAGNTDEGVGLAGNALLQNNLNSQLTGVFAVTNGTQIATGSSSSAFSAVGTLVSPEAAIVTTPVPVAPAAAQALQPPGWLMPALMGSGIAIVVILLVAMANAISRRRSQTAKAFHPNKPNGSSGSRSEGKG